MDQNALYRDIAGRCDGDIYLGVVGPVRTGKSTFIKRFMELLVLPNIEDESARDRTLDALPQSGAGRTIREHSTIGVVVTTDGSAVDMPRSAYEAAETRVIRELKALGKPFIIVLNAKAPASPEVVRLADGLSAQYGVPVHPVNAQEMGLEDLNRLLEGMLFEFPITEVRIQTPAWLTALPEEHWLARSVLDSVRGAAGGMQRVRDHAQLKQALDGNEYAEDALPVRIDLNDGTLEYRLSLKDGLFYRVLGEACGEPIEGEAHLFRLMKQLVTAKRAYDRVSGALEQARESGYGVVTPALDELALRPPELARQGVGIAIYPASDSHFSGDPDVTIKKLVDPAVTASYILVWDRTHHLTHAAESFVRSICSSAGVPFPGH